MKKLYLFILFFSILDAKDYDLSQCARCHGANFEKSAFHKSKIVRKMSVEDIKASLKRFSSTKYENPTIEVMKMQLYDYPDIDKLATSIWNKINK